MAGFDEMLIEPHAPIADCDCGDCARVERNRLRAENDRLRTGLRFYANGHHMQLNDPSAWDTVSGEPQNWWCDEGTATIEDGWLAKKVLRNEPLDWSEFDETPPTPIEGEH